MLSVNRIHVIDPNLFIRLLTLDNFLITKNGEIKLFMLHYSIPSVSNEKGNNYLKYINSEYDNEMRTRAPFWKEDYN